MPFTVVQHKERFKSSIHPNSVLWDLVRENRLPPDTADVMLRYGTGTGRFKNGQGNS